MIANPPDLEEWRQKLFNVDDMITLTEEEYALTSLILCTFELNISDFRLTFHISTTSTRIARANGTSASDLCHITGTAD